MSSQYKQQTSLTSIELEEENTNHVPISTSTPQNSDKENRTDKRQTIPITFRAALCCIHVFNFIAKSALTFRSTGRMGVVRDFEDTVEMLVTQRSVTQSAKMQEKRMSIASIPFLRQSKSISSIKSFLPSLGRDKSGN